MASRIHRAGIDANGTNERGASLVEFALILPLFVTLILGMFTGGLAYNRKLTMTNAAREAARFAATLPLGDYSSLGEWIDAVGAVAIDAATGEVDPDAPGRELCVAYVHEAATETPFTTRKVVTGSGTFPGTAVETGAGKFCFDDTTNRPDEEKRVQVVLERGDRIELLLTDIDVTLTGRATNKYEAGSS